MARHLGGNSGAGLMLHNSTTGSLARENIIVTFPSAKVLGCSN